VSKYAFCQKLEKEFPDHLLAEHPHYAPVKARFDETAAYREKMQAIFNKSVKLTGALNRSIERLHKEHAELKARLPALAMQALNNSDTKFAAATDARAELQRILWEIEARADAIEGLRKAFVYDGVQRNAESAAQSHTAAEANLFTARCRALEHLADAAWDDTIDELPEWPGRDEAFEFRFARGLL